MTTATQTQTQTFTLFKNSPIPGGTYTDIAEFIIDKTKNTATVCTACKWARYTGYELDNGSDLFGSQPMPVQKARELYRNLLNQGYTATTRKFDLARTYHVQ